ncbi:hypothetical protein HUO13_28570 [Saccharopolyspora erythraea]|uniref:hypothetical protein n=1 Tax=Saccharopolyspora erythraea TaxID=1836 RepID=UPI001BA90403|nr:hypothetical protein [Saccharopolyspora erythraea]QUH04219.1 hypothetical protein HUO13_28570 [Saccharopolyspora erythraea]
MPALAVTLGHDQSVITPDPNYLRQSAQHAAAREGQFWRDIATLGIGDDQAERCLHAVLLEAEQGADIPDPYNVVTQRLAAGPTWRPMPESTRRLSAPP